MGHSLRERLDGGALLRGLAQAGGIVLRRFLERGRLQTVRGGSRGGVWVPEAVSTGLGDGRYGLRCPFVWDLTLAFL